MKLTNDFKLGIYEKAMPNHLSWTEKMMAAKSAGFDYIEISIDETDEKLARLEWSAEERQTLVTQMMEAGIRIETMCLSGHRRFPLGSPDPEKRAKSLEIMAKASQLAVDLGIRVIQLAGYDTYYDPSSEQTLAWFAEGLARSVEIASRDGVILGFETMETPFMNTVGKAMHYVDMINSPYLQVFPDIGNLTNAAVEYGTTVPEDLRTGMGHLAAVHLKETVPGKFREIPFGTGHTDFSTLIQLCLDMGVRRFTAEFWHVGEENWMEVMKMANQFLRERFPKS